MSLQAARLVVTASRTDARVSRRQAARLFRRHVRQAARLFVSAFRTDAGVVSGPHACSGVFAPDGEVGALCSINVARFWPRIGSQAGEYRRGKGTTMGTYRAGCASVAKVSLCFFPSFCLLHICFCAVVHRRGKGTTGSSYRAGGASDEIALFFPLIFHGILKEISGVGQFSSFYLEI